MKILFQHLRETDNIGDRWCSPYDYYDWSCLESSFFESVSVKDVNVPTDIDYDVGIYGGGKIFGSLVRAPGVLKRGRRLHVAWGVGTTRKQRISWRHMRAGFLMNLVGSRDYGHDNYHFAPCVSCLSPLFDINYDKKNETVFYYHDVKVGEASFDVPPEVPRMSNHSASLSEAIRFLGSGNTIITNSYHGAYWGLLLGRRVVCVPFSSKFFYFRLKPFYASPENCYRERHRAIRQPEMLGLCREATNVFRLEVHKTVEAFVNARRRRGT